MYTIGQVAKQVNMPVSTLRYYDNEGLFPHLVRSSGIRKFGEQEIEALHIIECLKNPAWRFGKSKSSWIYARKAAVRIRSVMNCFSSKNWLLKQKCVN